MALLPSQVLWSSLILKDPVVWVMLSGIALAVVQAPRGSRRLAVGLVVIGALLLGLAFTRLRTMEIALVALVLASLLAPSRYRIAQVAATAGIALLLPLAFVMGPGGATFVANSGSLEQRRVNNAVAAVERSRRGAAGESANSDRPQTAGEDSRREGARYRGRWRGGPPATGAAGTKRPRASDPKPEPPSGGTSTRVPKKSTPAPESKAAAPKAKPVAPKPEPKPAAPEPTPEPEPTPGWRMPAAPRRWPTSRRG